MGILDGRISCGEPWEMSELENSREILIKASIVQRRIEADKIAINSDAPELDAGYLMQ